MCEDPGIHLLRPHMWCLEIGNRSNVIKRVRKRCTHLNHMQITVKKKKIARSAQSVITKSDSRFAVVRFCNHSDSTRSSYHYL